MFIDRSDYRSNSYSPNCCRKQRGQNVRINEMTIYIDAKRYKKKLLNWAKDCDQDDADQVHVGQVIEDCAYSIDDEPSADVSPVIHAHWNKFRNFETVFECSNCLSVYSECGDDTYCRNCGAKMDEKTAEK